MAKKAARGEAEAEQTRSTEALKHGAQAYGARYLRQGFARTPELDLAFALGHGAVPVAPTPLPPHASPAQLSKLKWPDAREHRNVAIHCLRVDHEAWKKPVTAEAAPAPIGEDEARAIVATQMPRGVLMADDYRALEAMVGPSCLLPACVDALERIPKERFGGVSWDNNTLQPIWALVHGLMLRVTEAEHRVARERLEALYAHRHESHGARYLDILLHGVEGIRRRGYKYDRVQKSYRSAPGSDDPASQFDLMFLDGEPEFVERSFEALWSAFSWKPQKWMIGPSRPRLFFVGGPGMLQHELRAVDAYPKSMHAEAFESYCELRAPEAVRLILRLTRDGSSVQKAARTWLVREDAWARPLLDLIAGEANPDAALARAALTAQTPSPMMSPLR